MKIFAHRGISGHYPENTLLAIQAAIDHSVYGIEIDVFAHAGELIVIHDRQLSRTAKVAGNIEDYTAADLRELDVGRGQHIPTLWQVLQLVANKAVLNIELKGHDTAALLLSTLTRAKNELGTDWSTLLISSFHHPLLHTIKQQQPGLAVGALTACIPLHYCQFATDLAAVSVHCDRAFVDRPMIEDAHQRGLKVYVYTVNDQREALRLQALGVDGIFCNYPAEAADWF